MTYGIRIRDPSGAVVLDVTTKMTFILGRYTLPGGGPEASGSFDIPDAGMSRYFAFIDGVANSGDTKYKFYHGLTPNITVSGHRISWKYPAGTYSSAPHFTITYGGIT